MKLSRFAPRGGRDAGSVGDVGSCRCCVVGISCPPKGAAFTCSKTIGRLVEEEGLFITRERGIVVRYYGV